MKKIIHKLKKNRLVSKIAALVTICMIFVSCFTVSSFAADEEEATNSITDVWTGVTDSIMSLLGTAQGVFFGSYDSVTLLYGSPVSIDLIGSIYPILNFPSVNVGDVLFLTVDFGDEVVSGSLAIYDSSYPAGLNGVIFSEIAVLTVGSSEEIVAFSNPIFVTSTDTFEGWYTPVSFDASVSSSTPSLTFLGTLAVIGVALSIILLLVFVISRFIHLRG